MAVHLIAVAITLVLFVTPALSGLLSHISIPREF
jgi:hypothetical protein